MITHKIFKNMPSDGSTLKELLDWFSSAYCQAHQNHTSKNKVFMSSLEAGYCGEEMLKYSESEFLKISLTYCGSWGFESFEQVSLSIPTKIHLSGLSDFFIRIDSPSEFKNLATLVKNDPIFQQLLEKTMIGHKIEFGEFIG